MKNVGKVLSFKIGWKDTMRVILVYPLALCFLAALTLGLQTESVSAAGKSFWTPPLSVRNCGGNYARVEPFKLTKTLVRARFPVDYGVNFTHHFGIGLSRTMAGQDVQSFKKYILSVAKSKAFTRASYDTQKGGNSPYYVQANIVRLIALYITFMESKNLLSPTEREILISWGAPMIAGQKGRKGNSAPDSRAASGVALMSWGSVTGDARLITLGQNNWRQALPFVIGNIGKLRRHPDNKNVPLSGLSMEDEYNSALAPVIEGAAIMENLGVSAFNRKYKGRTVHDAINWWTTVVVSRPPNFDSYRRKNHTWTLGWIPIYLSKYPNSPSAGPLRKIAKEVSRGRRPMFEAIALGTSTDCIWGYR